MAVLVLDDEEKVLSAVKRELRSEPFDLFTSASEEEALQILGQGKVKVVVSDHRLSRENQRSFLARVKELYPDIVRIQFSGYSDPQAIENSINRDEVFRFIEKPWDSTTLKTSISEAIKHYDFVEKNRSFIASTQKQIENLTFAQERFRQACQQHQGSLNKLHIEIRGKLADIIAMIRQIESKAVFPKDDLFLVLNVKINSLFPLIYKLLDHPQTFFIK